LVAFIARPQEGGPAPASSIQGFVGGIAWQSGTGPGVSGSTIDRLVEALSRRLESEMDAREFAGCPNLRGGLLKGFVEQFQAVPIDVMRDLVGKCQMSLSDVVRSALCQIMLDISEIRDRKSELESKLGLKFSSVKPGDLPAAPIQRPKESSTGSLPRNLPALIASFNAEFVGSIVGLSPIDISKVWETCEQAKRLLWKLGANLRAERQLQDAERATQAYLRACKISDLAPRSS
jgi:hypothetical protein